tara:strand:+ start:154 stop:591 length:438 start_codon:yes stop_codon:yes gene_type:complete
MGNRAVIAFVDDKGKQDKNSVGIYLHWNGGRDSVEGFLQAAKDYGLRSGSYGVARLTQIICNCFPGTISVGVDVLKKLDCDNYDNGVYWVDKNFNIVGREHIEKYGLPTGNFKEQQVYKLADFVKEVKGDNDFVFDKDPYKKLAS